MSIKQKTESNTINIDKIDKGFVVEQIQVFLNSLKCNDLWSSKITNPSYPFEYVFITTCLSERHVASCTNDLIEFIKKTPQINDFNRNILVNQKSIVDYKNPNSIISVDSTGSLDWISLEIRNIRCVVHFFTEGCRKKYDLESHIKQVNELTENPGAEV